ncbi:hypothetical protein D3C80_1775260 [compost metagenome]
MEPGLSGFTAQITGYFPEDILHYEIRELVVARSSGQLPVPFGQEPLLQLRPRNIQAMITEMQRQTFPDLIPLFIRLNIDQCAVQIKDIRIVHVYKFLLFEFQTGNTTGYEYPYFTSNP